MSIKRIWFTDKHLLFEDIVEFIINNKVYNKAFLKRKQSYIFVKNNIKKITNIKTIRHILKFKNGKLHCLDGPAIICHIKDEKFTQTHQSLFMLNTMAYYIDGNFYFALEYFKHEKRLQYIMKKERLRKFNNLI